jgi:hypothetical protein
MIRDRREEALPEGESYYVSMTDMMVGVVFIFILLLSFFALQYRATTTALTKADDPKTAALLVQAKALQNKTIAAQVDYQNRVLCVPTNTLTDGAASDAPAASDDRRCFAFSPPASSAATPSGPSSDQQRSEFTSFVNNDLMASQTPVHADFGSGALTFNADDLFLQNSDALSPKGVAAAGEVAKTLATRLPCYGYVASANASSCANGPKMAAVEVAGNTSFNAFSPEGQQAWDLALKRTVAFYKALTTDKPVLGQIKDGPAGQPLLRVASGGQSSAAGVATTAQQSISVQFVMAPP